MLVGLDVGTTGVKAIAVGAGRRGGRPSPSTATRSRPRGPGGRSRIQRTGGARPRPRSPTSALASGVGARSPASASRGRCTASSRSTPPIASCGRRSSGTISGPAAECVEIEERIGLDRLIALTGNRALTGFTAPKLLWLRRNEPEAFGRIARIMLPKDYVRLRLTGEWATDVADASGTLLLDVAHRGWSAEVLGALDLDPGLLPRCSSHPRSRGSRSRSDDVAAGIPVAAGAGDCAAAALGVGIDRPGPLSIVMGTSGVVFAALPAFASDPQARVHAFCHAVPGQWHAMGVMLSAAGSLQWLRDRLAPEASFAELVSEAEAWGPGSKGCCSRRTSPVSALLTRTRAARGAFTGLELRHDRGALVRAVLEGVAFGLRDSLELVRELGGPADRARASGGGARGLWLRIVASVLGIPIELTAVAEGSAYGAALLGGVAGGLFADVQEAVARCVRVAGHGRARSCLAGGVRRHLCALPRVVPGPPNREGAEDDEGSEVGNPLDGRHQSQAARRSRGVGRRRRRGSCEPRSRPRRGRTLGSGGSIAPTARTTIFSPIRRSRRSTSRCRTRCTASGRSGRSRPASTCSARSRSAVTSPTSNEPSTPPSGRGCTSRRRSCTGTTHRPRGSRSSWRQVRSASCA